MINNPKVSIIIPAYNAAKYLKQSIDSALNQTYSNIEIIVVNDGSCDNKKTEKIALSYKSKIKYFYKKNGGVSSALNLGLREMTGDYFSWLSHDDLYYPQKIEEQINYLQKINCENAILYSDYELIDEKNLLIGKCINDHDLLVKKPEYAFLRGIINGITLLIPKEAFENCGNFDEDLSCVQDYDLWYKMLLNQYDFIHVPHILAKSRYHSKQVSKNNPNVVTEGNKFWIYMIDAFELKTKEKLDVTEYNYYNNLASFLEYTPYKEAQKHCIEKCNAINKITRKSLNNIKVSIVIPFFNRIDLLERAINSCLEQTHQNTEIILINDGSSQNIDSILQIISNHQNIILINLEKNCGPANARNVGIDNATGKYIAFLDSDDYFLKNKIEEQLLHLELTNLNVSHTSYYKNKSNVQTIIHSGTLAGKVQSKLIYDCSIATPTVMINLNYLKDNNYRFNSTMQIGEDTCFWMEILNNTTLLGIDIPLTVVNCSEDSAIYNTTKQILGLKNILTYVLNNKNLNMYDYEISILAREYSDIVSSQISKIKSPNKLTSFFVFVKDKGLREGIIKIKEKLIK